MKIGIIVAMQKELNLLLPLLEDKSEISINNVTFHTGNIGRHSIVAAQCGIGKVNAAVYTLTLIENFHPALVINTGVAGGTGKGADILDIVVADRIAYHDCWCGPGTEWGEASGCPRYFTPPSALLELPVLETFPRLKKGLIASGDIFVSRKEDVEHILSVHPDTIAVDMESAAIAQVCYLKSVPFLCVRVLSDTPGAADNIAQYENFWTDAPTETFNVLTSILKNI